MTICFQVIGYFFIQKHKNSAKGQMQCQMSPTSNHFQGNYTYSYQVTSISDELFFSYYADWQTHG